MNKNKKLWSILGGIILLLTAVGVWDNSASEKEKTQSAEKKVLEFKPEDVVAVEIKNPPGGEVPQMVGLKKEGGAWNLLAPEAGLADGAVIDTMIKLLADFTYTKVAGDGESTFAGYGVTEELARKITLTKMSGDKIDYWFGSKSPVGYSVYVRHSLKPTEVLVANQHLLSATSKTVIDLRDKSIFTWNSATASDIEMGDIHLMKKADAGWTLTGNKATLPADGTLVDSWLGELIALKAIEFSAPNKEDSSLPKLIVKDDKGVVLFNGRAGAIGESVRVVDEAGSRGFKLDGAAKSVFGKKVADFRLKKVLDLPIADLNSVKINSMSFTKTGEKWQENSADPAKGSSVDAGAFVMDLDFARATDFADRDKKSPKSPEWTIDLETSKGAKRKLLVYDTKSPENVAIGSEDRPDLMIVPKKVFDKLASAK